MVDFDAFASDIVYGGLRSMLEIKVLVCYLLDRVKEPMSRKQLCDCVQETGLVNYFDINTAIDELLESGMIYEDMYQGDEALFLAEKGKNNAAVLETTLTNTTRDRSVKAALKLLARARTERETKSEITKTETGYQVAFEIEGFGEKLMGLSLYAADVLQAEQLKEAFLNDAAGLYTTVIDKLTSEK